MAQHDRCMLNKHDIERFKAWLTDNRITWREGKGDFQLLQVKLEKGWGAICTSAKGVITSPQALRSMIQHFQAGKPLKAKPAAKPVEDQQFLNDLRDDFAMAAMQARAAGDYSAWSDLAADAYNIADAMLAERAKRIGGQA